MARSAVAAHRLLAIRPLIELVGQIARHLRRQVRTAVRGDYPKLVILADEGKLSTVDVLHGDLVCSIAMYVRAHDNPPVCLIHIGQRPGRP